MTAQPLNQRMSPVQQRLADEAIASVVTHIAKQGISGSGAEQVATETANALRAGFSAFSAPHEPGSKPTASGAETRCKCQETRPCCCRSCHRH